MPPSPDDHPSTAYRLRVASIFVIVGLAIVAVLAIVAALAWARGESPQTMGAIVFIGLAGAGLTAAGLLLALVAGLVHWLGGDDETDDEESPHSRGEDGPQINADEHR